MSSTTKRLEAHIAHVYSVYYAKGACNRKVLLDIAHHFSMAARFLSCQARTLAALEGSLCAR